jgi:hypothetical protein
MGEILGLGVTHGPMLAHLDKDQGNMLKRRLASPQLPDHLRDPANWPEPMRLEWGNDDGEASAHEQRMRLLEDFRKCRRALDDFKPDAVLIWGDDQFENFHEDVIPPFCVHMAPEFEKQPWAQPRGLGTAVNMWGEDADFTLRVKGHPQAAKHLVTSLMEQRVDIAYAYKQLHDPFPHAFWRTVLYLDADRTGWNYPVIPFHVNCIGNRVTGSRFGELGSDPPGPTPGRCFEVGAAVARAFRDGPYRVALVGSSSWSHAFLAAKNDYLFPDVEADRKLYGHMVAGRYDEWKRITNDEIEDSAQHEMLNWMCLLGAMEELGRKPDFADFVESWSFNSCKAMAIFYPESAKAGTR